MNTTINLYYILCYSLIACLLSQFFLKNYIPFFKKNIIFESIYYLEDLDVKYKILSKIEEPKLTFINNKKDFFLLLFSFGFLFINTYYLFQANLSFEKFIILALYILFSFNIGWLDHTTQWLTNDCIKAIFLLGLFNIYFSEDYFLIINFIFGYLTLMLLSYALDSFGIGKGDFKLVAVFFLFFDFYQILNIIIIASLFSFCYFLIHFFLFSIYLKNKRKKRNKSFSSHLKSARIFFELNPSGFGQWLLLASIFIIYLEIYHIPHFLFSPEKFQIIKSFF